MNIQELVQLSMNKAVLIDFWAEWCGPCKTFGPVLEKLEEKYSNNLHLEKVDVDEDPEMAAQFRVQSIPTIVLLSEGKVAGVSQGAMSEPQLQQWLEKHLPDLQPDEEQLDWREKLKLLPSIPSDERSSQIENWLRILPEDKELQLEYLRSISFSNPPLAEDFLIQFKKANESHWVIPYFEFLLTAINTDGTIEASSSNDWFSIVDLISKEELDRAAHQFTQLAANGITMADEDLRRLAVAFFTCLGDTHEVSLKYRKLFNMYLT